MPNTRTAPRRGQNKTRYVPKTIKYNLSPKHTDGLPNKKQAHLNSAMHYSVKEQNTSETKENAELLAHSCPDLRCRTEQFQGKRIRRRRHGGLFCSTILFLTFDCAASVVAALLDITLFGLKVVGRRRQKIVVAVWQGCRIVSRLALPLQARKILPADACA